MAKLSAHNEIARAEKFLECKNSSYGFLGDDAEYATAEAWKANRIERGWTITTEGQASTLNTPKAKAERDWHYPGELTAEYQTAIARCFPDWKGKKVYTRVGTYPSRLDSYWDGGSRDRFAFFNTVTREVLSVHSNHPWFEADQPNTLRTLPSHILLLCHSIFCGKEGGITIYANPTPANMPDAIAGQAIAALSA
jgi:hypothetical protein